MIVRSVEERDFPALARLAEQLGYQTAAHDIAERVNALREDQTRNLVLVAAVADGHVVAWIHAFVHVSLITERRVEIAGLVVDEQERGKAIGRLLVAAAEDWAARRGVTLMRLSSHTKRLDARRFYERLGYEVTKTSNAFVKRLTL